MKILFLDIDGVLNNNYTRSEETYKWVLGWDVTSCILLRNFVNKNDIKIVVSSDWRFDMYLTLGCLISIGIKPQLIIGRTSIDHCDKYAGAEGRIIEILESVDKLKPTHWVAIDDLPLGINKDMIDHFVETHDDVGLTTVHIEKMAKILEITK